VLLITHGTLFHNASELITTLQELFSENEISSLAINLSLGLDNRHHAYDCAIPHTHKHDDAVGEIGIWLNWLKNKAQALVDDHKGHSFLNSVDFIYCKDTKATAEAFVSYYNTDLRKDTLFVLPEIKKPILIFAGTEDTVVKDLGKKIEQMSPQENIKLEVMDGADHSFRDLYSEEIVDFSVEFINSTR
jgi:alpha/beta superfamily hydrolase